MCGCKCVRGWGQMCVCWCGRAVPSWRRDSMTRFEEGEGARSWLVAAAVRPVVRHSLTSASFSWLCRVALPGSCLPGF